MLLGSPSARVARASPLDEGLGQLEGCGEPGPTAAQPPMPIHHTDDVQSRSTIPTNPSLPTPSHGLTRMVRLMTIDQGCQLHQVSAHSESLLKEAFGKPVPNRTRCRWRKTHHARPKLESTLRAQVPKACKDADRLVWHSLTSF